MLSAFTLAEPLMAIAVIAVVASSALYTLFASNRYVASQRLVSSAKALCQERIDEALSDPFTPTRVPAFFGGAWPLPAVETLTSTENVPLYFPQDSATTPLVSGTRRTWVSGVVPNAATPNFTYARVRVRVEFWNNGRGVGNVRVTAPGAHPLFYEMITLRSPD